MGGADVKVGNAFTSWYNLRFSQSIDVTLSPYVVMWMYVTPTLSELRESCPRPLVGVDVAAIQWVRRELRLN